MIIETIVTGGAVAAAGKIKEDSLLGMLYKDTLQPSVQSLGRALGATLEFCTTPLLLCKFGSEAAKLNYQKHLDNYAEKLRAIPEAEAIPVNPQIGTPIMEKLAYTTNEEIADLFTTLLAKASSSDTVNLAHPAFIQIIERLSPDEALVLKSLHDRTFIPFVGLIVNLTTEGHNVIKKNDTDLKFSVPMTFPQNILTYLDNITSLGLLHQASDRWLVDEEEYRPLYEKYNYAVLEEGLKILPLYKDIERTKGVYSVTDFGRSFIKACAVR